MENNVSEIRDAFYNDLIREYQSEPRESFLYEHFWKKGVEELLKKYGKELPKKPKTERPEIELENEGAMEFWLWDAVKGNPESAMRLLQKNAPAKSDKRERRDFWGELWLWDACYQAGLVSDTDYYVWLVEYLEARDIYYKDIGCGEKLKDAHTWLYKLLQAGLGTQVLPTDLLRKKDIMGETKNIRNKTQVEGDLRRLAELLRNERDEENVQGEQDSGAGKAVCRLHGLKRIVRVSGENRKRDYLPWLTHRLKDMALHIKIKTWLQDSGYSFKIKGNTEGSAKTSRKQDFSMQLFDAYLRKNYEFARKDEGGASVQEMWQWKGQFLEVKRELAQKLFEGVRADESDLIYVPLAIHLYTGCVFFLAGKGNYEKLYEEMRPKFPKDSKAFKQMEAYDAAMSKWQQTMRDYEGNEECCCFDYLRLDKSHEGLNFRMGMQPHFLENAGKGYDAVLDDFKRHCYMSEENMLQVLREMNGEMPPGIPSALLWAFDGEECGVGEEEALQDRASRESRADFRRTQDKIMERRARK